MPRATTGAVRAGEPAVTILLGDKEAVAALPTDLPRRFRVVRGCNLKKPVEAHPLLVLASASRLSDVAPCISAASKANRLQALLVRSDVDPAWIPYMLKRAGLRTLRNMLVHGVDSPVPARVLAAWASGEEQDLIASVTVVGDTLVVLTCALEEHEVPFNAYPALRRIAPAGRDDVRVEDDGAFLYWPASDVRMDLDDIRFLKDPARQAKARAQRIAQGAELGAAIRAVRKEHGLTQSSVTGLSERHVRRLERGEPLTSGSLDTLAAAHGLSPEQYLEHLTDALDARAGSLQTQSSDRPIAARKSPRLTESRSARPTRGAGKGQASPTSSGKGAPPSYADPAEGGTEEAHARSGPQDADSSERAAGPTPAGDRTPSVLPEVSADDLDAVEWQCDLPDAVDIRRHDRVFYERAEQAKAGGDLRASSVFEVLGHACSLHLRLDRPDKPFGSRVEMGQFRSASIDEISDVSARAFGAVLPRVADAALRARLGDLAWVKVRDYAAANTAVDAYLTIVDRYLDPGDWPHIVRALERALQLAAILGRKSQAANRVTAKVEMLLASSDADGYGFRAARLMRLLLEYGRADLPAMIGRASLIAGRALAAREWHRARAYWELAAEMASAAKEPDRRREALANVAAAYEAEAEEALGRPGLGHTMASMHLQKAIEVLRKAGGFRERASALHARLVEVQHGAAAELLPISSTVDLTDAAEAAEQAVSGKSLQDALVLFATLPVLQSVSRLRAHVDEQGQRYVLSSLFPKVAIDTDGKVIARQGAMSSSDPQVREAALRVEMITQAALHYQVSAVGVINPARQAIMREHPLEVAHLAEVAAHHPLVPPGREMLVAEGLYAGFVGDLPKAIHLLVPQLENSIRVLLEQSGVAASTLNKYGLQEERNLNRLLYEPALKDLLGEDTVFAMQALLVEKFGPDLRNRTAHGLLDHHGFYGGEAMSLWWLAFRFAMLPLMKVLARSDVSEDTPSPVAGGGSGGVGLMHDEATEPQ